MREVTSGLNDPGRTSTRKSKLDGIDGVPGATTTSQVKNSLRVSVWLFLQYFAHDRWVFAQHVFKEFVLLIC
jgi:hypothetical protein